MKSVIQHLGTEKFTRIRVGIGRPNENMDIISHVIGAIPKEEKKLLDEGVNKAKEAVIEIIKNGVESGMNKFN